MEVTAQDKEALIREKHGGDRHADLTKDIARLTAGEPLAYVIGTMPFLGLTLDLSSRPLIPRPETERWTELLIQQLGSTKASVLDLCAGSGAIGLALLRHCQNVHVSFGELVPAHEQTIRKNIEHNGLDASRATIRTGDLFAPFADERFDIIVSNPPYIPEDRTLPASVTAHEPAQALYGGTDGLSVIRRIAREAPTHLLPQGELWMECDIDHIEEARDLVRAHGATTARIRTDQYERPRIVVAYYCHGSDSASHS